MLYRIFVSNTKSHGSKSYILAGVPEGYILWSLLLVSFKNDTKHEKCSCLHLFTDYTSLFMIVNNPTSTAKHPNANLVKIL